MDKKPKPKNNQVKNMGKSQTVWSIKILVLSFALSMCFGVLSELVLKSTGIIIAIVIIILFVSIAIIMDMIGVATTSADIKPFQAMASKKVRGAREAIKLISKADRVSSICCDVIGDVCGILSGAAGASILLKLAIEASSPLSIIVASLISAVVASLTILGKSICKNFAVHKSTGILLTFGKFISLFTPQQKNQNKKQVEKSEEREVKTDIEE